MKFKISKKQWETMGVKSGWLNKKADIEMNLKEINFIVRQLQTITPHSDFADDPTKFENDDFMISEIINAERFLNSIIKFSTEFLPPRIENAKRAIESLKGEYNMGED